MGHTLLQSVLLLLYPKKPPMHVQLALLLAPDGAMELLPHAVTCPLLQNVLSGQSTHPPPAVGMKPGLHTQSDAIFIDPGFENVLMGHWIRSAAFALILPLLLLLLVIIMMPGHTYPASHC